MAFSHRSFYQVLNGAYWNDFQYVPDSTDTAQDLEGENYFRELTRQLRPMDRIHYTTKDLSEAGTLVVTAVNNDKRAVLVRDLASKSPETKQTNEPFAVGFVPKVGWRVRDTRTKDIVVDNLASKEEALEYIKMEAA